MRPKGTPKTGGRQKGSTNKATTETRQWINNIINDNRDTLEKDLKTLEPQQRWAIVEKLLQYTTPKMQSVTAEVDLTKLSEEALDTIIDELTNDIDL